jgi:TM2 domain-containing membrane protein YozV
MNATERALLHPDTAIPDYVRNPEPQEQPEEPMHPGAYHLPYKSVGVAYVLLVLFGSLGVHRFYLRQHFTGVLFILTFGFFGLGVLIDLFLIPSNVRQVNDEIEIIGH